MVGDNAFVDYSLEKLFNTIRCFFPLSLSFSLLLFLNFNSHTTVRYCRWLANCFERLSVCLFLLFLCIYLYLRNFGEPLLFHAPIFGMRRHRAEIVIR